MPPSRTGTQAWPPREDGSVPLWQPRTRPGCAFDPDAAALGSRLAPHTAHSPPMGLQGSIQISWNGGLVSWPKSPILIFFKAALLFQCV